ncbi:MAG TPA: class I SAM-dependent methyltransferase [Terriglobales bacterium]|nr:class I SAM-dependent methyltransferase [Terriglobales bacterium]
MSLAIHAILRFFRPAPNADPLAQPSPAQQRITRRSSGFTEFARRIVGQEPLNILDLGPTSPANIEYLTNLGHKVYNEDVLHAGTDPALVTPGEGDKPTIDVARFLSSSLQYEPEKFDAVLCWDVADYMPEVLVKPMVDRIHRATKPGGSVLAFFHTKDAGPDAPYYRYHIGGPETLSLQAMWKQGPVKTRVPLFRLQRIFQNRHVENLFRDYGSLKFFLARDNVREIIVLR